METNKCYGYIRVSTELQDNSLKVQEQRIKDYCAFNHLELVELLIDENISGFKPIYKRPAGQKLQNLYEVKNIVAIKPDRLFRNTKDALITIDDWDEQGVILHFADVGGVSLSTKTAIGKLMFTTIISFAQFERDMAGERTKTVLNHKKDKGKVYCGEILGYDKAEGFLVRNEAEQAIIQMIFEMKAEGLNNNKIAVTLNEKQLRTKNGGLFQGSTVQTILNNPIHKQVA